MSVMLLLVLCDRPPPGLDVVNPTVYTARALAADDTETLADTFATDDARAIPTTPPMTTTKVAMNEIRRVRKPRIRSRRRREVSRGRLTNTASALSLKAAPVR